MHSVGENAEPLLSPRGQQVKRFQPGIFQFRHASSKRELRLSLPLNSSETNPPAAVDESTGLGGASG